MIDVLVVLFGLPIACWLALAAGMAAYRHHRKADYAAKGWDYPPHAPWDYTRDRTSSD